MVVCAVQACRGLCNIPPAPPPPLHGKERRVRMVRIMHFRPPAGFRGEKRVVPGEKRGGGGKDVLQY